MNICKQKHKNVRDLILRPKSLLLFKLYKNMEEKIRLKKIHPEKNQFSTYISVLLVSERPSE